MRSGATTEKWPPRAEISSASREPASPGFGIGKRNSTTSHTEGKLEPLANSPKSLSKVSRIRCSGAANASTSASAAPGASILTQTTSCPAASRAAITAPGKFLSARKRMSGCAWKYSFGTQGITRVGQTRNDIIVGQTRIVRQNVGFAQPIGHQANHEFHG